MVLSDIAVFVDFIFYRARHLGFCSMGLFRYFVAAFQRRDGLFDDCQFGLRAADGRKSASRRNTQPIVENAVKHAVAPRANGGRVFISAKVDDGNLIIKVRDDGNDKLPANEQNGNGLGLRLVRESLAARFGSAASLNVETAANDRFTVSITIPRFDFSEKISKGFEAAARNL